MLKYFISSIFAFSQTITYCQPKAFDDSGDTTYWYQLKQEDAKKLGFWDLTKSTDNFHFRFWMENQAIDIWTNDFLRFYGQLAIFTNEVVKDASITSQAPAKFYSKISPIDSLTSKLIYQSFLSQNIFRIPTDSKIKGWYPGDDGEEYIMEYASKNFYSFKTYWTPSIYKNIPEAVLISKISKEMETTFLLNEHLHNFMKGLPKGCYRVGEMMLYCSEMNK